MCADESALARKIPVLSCDESGLAWKIPVLSCDESALARKIPVLSCEESVLDKKIPVLSCEQQALNRKLQYCCRYPFLYYVIFTYIQYLITEIAQISKNYPDIFFIIKVNGGCVENFAKIRNNFG
jgi:hypothetical protein